jgi:hypothetical protein
VSTGDAVLMTRPTGSLAHVAPLARIAGVSYLLVIAGGLFAQVVVRGSLIVPGNAAATAQAITVNESLWRWGLAVHLLYLIPATVMNVLLYVLFKRAHVTLARLGLVFSIVAVTIEAMSLVTLYGPLAIADEGAALAAVGETQLQALAYLSVRLFSTGFGFSLVFFATFCALAGVLILRSRLVPRVIGVMMIAAGVCYLVNSLAAILAPSFSNVLFPWILLPVLLGELALALWLVVKGVNDHTEHSGRDRAVTGRVARGRSGR